MAQEIDPGRTSRAAAFAAWMGAPMPMVTLTGTFDAGRLLRLARRGFKFNMLLCWCIGQAASQTPEFYLLPVDGKLLRYDKLAVNVVVATRAGGIATCDVPFSGNLARFNRDYLTLTRRVRDTGRDYALGEDYMVIGTSALPGFALDSAVNIYAGVYNNPFLLWGKCRRGLLGAKLPISFQFHHVQMDGQQAAQFLSRLQWAMLHPGRKGGPVL